MQEQTNQSTFRLPDATRMGTVHLRVADLEQSLAFYRDILGYTARQLETGVVALSAADQGPPHIVLHERAGAKPVPRRATGLFHVAILLPARRDLAKVMRHLAEHEQRLGASDHAVSEALYLDDPDGNGLEIYADRPRAEWPYHDGELGMGTEQLNVEDLLGELRGPSDTWDGIPAGSTVGHVHLKVSSLEQAERFFVGTLGFDVTVPGYPGALFVSAGGYHHHIGMNTWMSEGASDAGSEYSGLVGYTIVLPDRDSHSVVVERLQGQGVAVDAGSDSTEARFEDVDGNQVTVKVAGT